MNTVTTLFKKIVKLLIIAIALVLLIFSIRFTVFAYHANDTAKECLKSTSKITVSEISHGLYYDGPGKDTALVFYPGAAVDFEAYAPLMQKLAGRGIDCFLMQMPVNFAFLGTGFFHKVHDSHTYDHWLICGHSLGGVAASMYAAKHPEEIDGIVFLASYPAADLSACDFPALTLTGSGDKVLNRSRLTESASLLPKVHTEKELPGGNHAWFGSYGKQKGDGRALVTHKIQWVWTAKEIRRFIKAH